MGEWREEDNAEAQKGDVHSGNHWGVVIAGLKVGQCQRQESGVTTGTGHMPPSLHLYMCRSAVLRVVVTTGTLACNGGVPSAAEW